MIRLAVITPMCKGHGFRAPGLSDDMVIHHICNGFNRESPCQVYQRGLGIENCNNGAEILIHAHDDVTIHDEHWKDEIEGIFDDNPDCVAVGLGGATGLGTWDLYRRPFKIDNIARQHYYSNTSDAEVHGERFTGRMRVAVLDGFLMAVRRSFLVRSGGWPCDRLTHHCLDLWLACEAARAGKEIWITGVPATHAGGLTSSKDIYKTAPWLQGGTVESDHLIPHRWIWDTYRDVLPLEI